MSEAPTYEHVRSLTRSPPHSDEAPGPKNSKSEEQKFDPNTPVAVNKRPRSEDPAQDSNTSNKRPHVVASSSLYHRLTPGETIENRSYEYEENTKQVLVTEYSKRDGEVIGITGNKQVYKFGQTHQEAERIHKHPESSSPRQQSWSNTLALHDVISHIEQVGATVSSHVEALRNEMDMKMEEIKQMIDDRTVKTKKGGFKLPSFKIKNGKK